MIVTLQRSGMIAAVTLRMLYPIFQQVFGLVLLMSRVVLSKDVELLLRHEVAALRRTEGAGVLSLAALPGRPR